MADETSGATAATVDEEIDAGGMLEVLDPTGHFEVRWGRKKSEADMAEAQFNDLLSKGYVAFKKTWLGRKGKQAPAFDAKERAYIFEKGDAPPAPQLTDAPDEKVKDDPIEVEAKKEDAVKSERFENAKRVRDEAIDRAKAARAEHDEASRKCRDARSLKEAASQDRSLTTGLEQAASRRLEAATKALEDVQRETVAPDDLVKTEERTGRLVAATTELDAASKAVTEAKKVREDAEAKLSQAQIAFDAVVNDADAARKRRREADELAESKRSECDEAEKDLKGEFEHQQTKEFDKKADHTLVPPLRGG